MFHGDKTVAAAFVPAGAAVKIGSTPASIVITVGCEPALPSVATNTTASPLFRSDNGIAGMRANIC
jgi:hypothetical protein